MIEAILILTFNMWAVPDAGYTVISPLREARVSYFCESVLKKTKRWDVILLQEVWEKKDREKLKKCGYPYSAERESEKKLVDSGLMILSRFPLEKIEKLSLPKPGLGAGLTDGEAFANKSMLIARVVPKNHPPFWVANTHFVAPHHKGKDPHLKVRQKQLDFFIKETERRAGDERIIVGGDFNFGPRHSMWKDIEDKLKLYAHGNEEKGMETVAPPNFMHSEVEGKYDHLFGKGFKVTDVALAVDEAIPVQKLLPKKALPEDAFKVHLSDHFGFETQFVAN